MFNFVCGLFVGGLAGVLVICLLAGPRIAELESTVQSLRQVLSNQIRTWDEPTN